jgi:hypothetical protein
MGKGKGKAGSGGAGGGPFTKAAGRGVAGRVARRRGAAAPVHLPHDPSGSARRSLQCRPPLLWPRRPLAARS